MTEPFYPVLVTALPVAEGGGFLATVPDLPGCMADGATPEAAVTEVRQAIGEWLDEAQRLGRPVPTPSVRPEKLIATTVAPARPKRRAAAR